MPLYCPVLSQSPQPHLPSPYLCQRREQGRPAANWVVTVRGSVEKCWEERYDMNAACPRNLRTFFYLGFSAGSSLPVKHRASPFPPNQAKGLPLSAQYSWSEDILKTCQIYLKKLDTSHLQKDTPVARLKPYLFHALFRLEIWPWISHTAVAPATGLLKKSCLWHFLLP